MKKNDIENLLSYSFLLYYKIGSQVKDGIEFLYDDELGHNDMLNNLKEFYEKEGCPKIYDLFDNPKLLVDFAYIYLQNLNKLEVISEKSIKLLLLGYYKVDPATKKLDKIITEVFKIININWRRRMAFDAIQDGYIDYLNTMEDHNVGFSELNNRLRRSFKSAYNVEVHLDLSKQRIHKDVPVNQYIIDNLPMEVLKVFTKLTDKRITGYFKRKLAADLQKVLIPLQVNAFIKLSCTGWFFCLFSMCRTFKEFSSWYCRKHKISTPDIQVMHEYYQEYLFDQAKNALK